MTRYLVEKYQRLLQKIGVVAHCTHSKEIKGNLTHFRRALRDPKIREVFYYKEQGGEEGIRDPAALAIERKFPRGH